MLPQFKKIISAAFVLGVLMLPRMVCAQEMDKPIIDKFTGDTTYSTMMETIASDDNTGEYLFAYFSKTNGVVSLNLRVKVSIANHNAFSVGNGNNILIKLSDNSLVSLSNTSGAPASQLGDYWMINLIAALSNDDAKEVSGADFKAIRITADDQNIDYTITPKVSTLMEKMLLLITYGIKM